MNPHTKTVKQDCTTFQFTSKTKQQIVVHLTGSPKSASIGEFSRFMKDKAVTDVFCFCEPEYDRSVFQDDGFNYHNLEFPDGSTPEQDLLDTFDQIFDQIVEHSIGKTTSNIQQKNKSEKGVQHDIVINMHCQSGMGRAPTMLAYLMITRCGFENIDTIDHIRKHRKGTFNKKQIDWIINTKLKISSKKASCILM